jgi:PHS family inorganic phosphate transporter-like MFS transporter
LAAKFHELSTVAFVVCFAFLQFFFNFGANAYVFPFPLSLLLLFLVISPDL